MILTYSHPLLLILELYKLVTDAQQFSTEIFFYAFCHLWRKITFCMIVPVLTALFIAMTSIFRKE